MVESYSHLEQKQCVSRSSQATTTLAAKEQWCRSESFDASDDCYKGPFPSLPIRVRCRFRRRSPARYHYRGRHPISHLQGVREAIYWCPRDTSKRLLGQFLDRTWPTPSHVQHHPDQHVWLCVQSQYAVRGIVWISSMDWETGIEEETIGQMS